MTNKETIDILIHTIKSPIIRNDGKSMAHLLALEAIGKAVEALEAEPKHGRWLRTDAYPHRIYCSACYATFIRNDEFLKLNDIPHDYCPNCGARMDEVEE